MKIERRMYIKAGRGEAVAHLMELNQARFNQFATMLAQAVEGNYTPAQGTQAHAVGVDVSALAELQAWRVQLDSINAQRDTFLIDKLERMSNLINVALAQGGLSHADIHTADGWSYTAKCLANWMAGKEFSALDDKADDVKPSEGNFVWDKQD